MAIYGNNNGTIQPATQTTRTPRTDYKKLIHNGKQFQTLDEMIDFIARERAHVAFKSTKLILAELGSKAKDETIAQAMIEANKKMIHEFLKNRDDSRGLFGLE